MYYGAELKELSFPKTGAEIETATNEKMEAIKAKLAMRESALRLLVKEAGLSDTVDVLLRLDDLMNKDASAAETPSEVKVKLQNLVRKIRDEHEEMERLSLVSRNIPREQTFDLSFAALEYFGF